MLTRAWWCNSQRHGRGCAPRRPKGGAARCEQHALLAAWSPQAVQRASQHCSGSTQLRFVTRQFRACPFCPSCPQYISNAIVTPPQTDDSDAAKFSQTLVK